MNESYFSRATALNLFIVSYNINLKYVVTVEGTINFTDNKQNKKTLECHISERTFIQL